MDEVDPDLAALADRRDRLIDHLPLHESGQVSADPRSRRRTLRPDQRALPFSELAVEPVIYGYSFILTNLDVSTPAGKRAGADSEASGPSDRWYFTHLSRSSSLSITAVNLGGSEASADGPAGSSMLTYQLPWPGRPRRGHPLPSRRPVRSRHPHQLYTLP